MLSVLPIQPHQHSMQHSPDMWLLHRVTQNQELQSKGRGGLHPPMPSLQRNPHRMEQCLPGKKERAGKNRASKAKSTNVLAGTAQGQTFGQTHGEQQSTEKGSSNARPHPRSSYHDREPPRRSTGPGDRHSRAFARTGEKIPPGTTGRDISHGKLGYTSTATGAHTTTTSDRPTGDRPKDTSDGAIPRGRSDSERYPEHGDSDCAS
ncbi:hypothetical protein I7I53_03952 [Histoplasma capsulatum var. duboisii H88]|uniref:Uncharacterized protein n=1 Tax=Ajellomyces capsulatus (strain H88) TaxID=544711 RepID=A0A8A1LNQ9_AJEC8|nr:hypothetical protein I7I53_03952 [Histoplasma capsulatum var. duboisii H88]